MRKTPAGCLRRGLNSRILRCYFLQHPVLQHSLPLQQLCFVGVAAVAVPIKATRLRINRRYFIKSPVEFHCETRLRDGESRAEPSQVRRTGYAAVAPADVGRAQSVGRCSKKSRRLPAFVRKTALHFRNKGISTRRGRCNTSLSSALSNRS